MAIHIFHIGSARVRLLVPHLFRRRAALLPVRAVYCSVKAQLRCAGKILRGNVTRIKTRRVLLEGQVISSESVGRRLSSTGKSSHQILHFAPTSAVTFPDSEHVLVSHRIDAERAKHQLLASRWRCLVGIASSRATREARCASRIPANAAAALCENPRVRPSRPRSKPARVLGAPCARPGAPERDQEREHQLPGLEGGCSIPSFRNKRRSA